MLEVVKPEGAGLGNSFVSLCTQVFGATEKTLAKVPTTVRKTRMTITEFMFMRFDRFVDDQQPDFGR